MAVKKYKPPGDYSQPGVGSIALDLTGDDLDLTDPEGPTGGYCARSLRVTGAGDVKFKAIDGTIDTWPCGDYDQIPIGVQYVYSDSNGSDATGVKAIL